MRAKKTKTVVAMLLLFSSLMLLIIGSVGAEDVLSIKTFEELDITPAYASGAVVMFRMPNDPESLIWWPSNPTAEPKSVEWTFMDPTYHIVYIDTHEPNQKYWVDDEGFWAWADTVSFELPAFTAKGNWYATPVTIMDDGTRLSYGTIYCIVDEDGSIWTNIFQAPIYIFGYKLPALFWCLSPVWMIGVIMGILFIYARSAEGIAMILADARDAGRRAREEWRKKKAQKEKLQ